VFYGVVTIGMTVSLATLFLQCLVILYVGVCRVAAILFLSEYIYSQLGKIISIEYFKDVLMV
jgi:hypothetical protein